jgi:hypothetical protein
MAECVLRAISFPRKNVFAALMFREASPVAVDNPATKYVPNGAAAQTTGQIHPRCFPFF